MTGPETRIELAGGGWLDVWPRAVADHDAWMARLLAELPLAREEFVMFGRTVAPARLVSWHGDPDAAYAYSGVAHEPAPWTPALAELRRRIENLTSLRFNAVLVNYYRDGSAGMGWHADAEPEVGPTPGDRWIASLSLGAPRRFALRHRRRAGDRHDFDLGHGALLVMRGTTQSHYRHAAPKTARPVGPRLNLTFRHIVARSARDPSSGRLGSSS